MRKRLFDLIFSSIGLLILAPILGMIAVGIKVSSPGPVFFRQERVGRNEKKFLIHKFRTMTNGAENCGLQITVGNDVRVTKIGKFLRKYKLDELPQLIDVWQGSMSIVGPRPEVPCFVDLYPKNIKSLVLSVRPGITDRASIEYKDENKILGAADDPALSYAKDVMPVKLKFYVDYVKNQSLIGDIKIVFRTLLEVFVKTR